MISIGYQLLREKNIIFYFRTDEYLRETIDKTTPTYTQKNNRRNGYLINCKI